MRRRARLCKKLVRSLRLPWDKDAMLFSGIADWRKACGKRWSISQVLCLAFLALCMRMMSFRGMEGASKDMGSVVRGMFGLTGWVSDNTFGRILSKVPWRVLQMRLWWQARAMRPRHELTHDELPLRTAALDGKVVASGKTRMSLFAQRSRHEVKGKKGEGECVEGRYKLHVLRVVLTSVRQKLCIWQHPLRSKKNEQSAARAVLKSLLKLDKGGNVFQLRTFDAMFLFYELTQMLDGDGRYFLGRIKENQRGLFAEAQRLLKPGLNNIPEYESGLVKDHKYWKKYRIWRTKDLGGCVTTQHTWDTIKEGWCVEVIRYTSVGKGRGKKAELLEFDGKVGYFATNLDSTQYPLSAAQCLKLVLSHWSIEDDCFNALDVQWKEDTQAYATSGEATLNRTFILMMAYNACQMIRREKEVNTGWDGKAVWMRWDAVFRGIDRALTTAYPRSVVLSERMLIV